MGVEVGTVDKFQGQEAVVVIVSMTTSKGVEAPRGTEFLFNPNRFNVAVSRMRRSPFIEVKIHLAGGGGRKHDVRALADLRRHDIDVDAEETALVDRAHPRRSSGSISMCYIRSDFRNPARETGAASRRPGVDRHRAGRRAGASPRHIEHRRGQPRSPVPTGRAVRRGGNCKTSFRARRRLRVRRPCAMVPKARARRSTCKTRKATASNSRDRPLLASNNDALTAWLPPTWTDSASPLSSTA